MVDRDTEPQEHSGPSYALSEERIHQLTAELFAERGSDTPKEYRYVAIEVSGESTYANIWRHIEREVFEATFPGNDAEKLTKEYSTYESASRFFISIDRTLQEATGVLRVIQNSPNGFMSLNDVAGDPFYIGFEEVKKQHSIDDLDELWDVGTVAVLPEHRNGTGSVSVQLYRAMYLSALKHDIKHLVSIIDEKALSKLTEYLAIPFVPLADTKAGPYLDSEKSQPVYGYVPDFFKKMNRHRYTAKGLLARKALNRLVKGSEDESLVFDPRL
jgi:hypothetical protein